MEKEIQEVLDYWFGELEEGFTKENRGELWYMGGSKVDQEIKEKFGVLVEKAITKELDGWKDTPLGRAALIILLDQFTRNVYRKTKQAFEADPYAQELCKEGIAKGDDRKLPPIIRAFFYHPLEHSESKEDQEESVNQFTQLHEEMNESGQKRTQSFVTYAKQHRDIIAQFGRFPHRNEVLGRTSTSEEINYLTEKNVRFGQ